MKRSFKSVDLVALPLLDVANLIALVVAILTAAKSLKDLPSAVAQAIEALAKELGILQDAKTDQHQVLGDPARARAIDVVVDACWRALEGWLKGWMILPGAPEALLAESVHAALFPDGLRFTQLPYRAQWAECATRLRLIDRDGFGDVIVQLGGAPLLAQIQKAHEDYGAALGVTEPMQDTVVPLREPADAVVRALRNLVVLVAAAGIDGTIDSESADNLLRPIVEWPVPRTKAVPPEPAPEPEQGPTPATPV